MSRIRFFHTLVCLLMAYAYAPAAIAAGGGGTGGTAGTEETPRNNSGSANAMELENCDCDTEGQTAAFNQIFYQAGLKRDNADPSNDHDDILVFGTRGTLSAADE